jgi:hypothetical protein
MPLRSSTPPSLLRARDEGNVLDAGRRVEQTVAGHGQAGGIGHRGALDGRLGAVEEAVEHLRVQAATRRLFGRQAVVAPDRVRRRLREVRQPLVAAAGRDHGKAAGACPVHQIADQRRLVAEGQRVHHAGVAPRLRASSGPQKASASTVTLTTCLPCAKASRQWIDRGTGEPVHSTIDVDLPGGRPAPASRRRSSVAAVAHGAASILAPARAAAPSPRAPGCGRRPRARDRRWPPDAPRACAGSAPGTSSRTCRRRSGRRGWGGLRRRVVAVDCAGSWPEGYSLPRIGFHPRPGPQGNRMNRQLPPRHGEGWGGGGGGVNERPLPPHPPPDLPLGRGRRRCFLPSSDCLGPVPVAEAGTDAAAAAGWMQWRADARLRAISARGSSACSGTGRACDPWLRP